jgi:hypothetical protein
MGRARLIACFTFMLRQGGVPRMKTLNRSRSCKALLWCFVAGLALAVSPPVKAQDGAWDPRFDASGFSNTVRAVAIAPNGHVFAGGDFTTTVGGTPVNRVAEWNGVSWSALGNNGVSDAVYAIGVDSNDDVYVGGIFTTAGGVLAGRIARWDGNSWNDLDGGMSNGVVYAIAVDAGDNVYAAGNFTVAGGTTALRVARWDGGGWSALGGGINNNDVYALAIAPNGDLYAGGNFTVAGGTTALRVAHWNGSGWSALGGGILDSDVRALAVTSNGDVYAGGTFTTAGGVVAGRVARWNGSTWSDLNGGVTSDVYALAANGGDLYAGGAFTVTGDGDALRIAKWSGGSWSNLGSGANDNVLALASSGKHVWAGGSFTVAGGKPSFRFGHYNPDIVPVLIQDFTATPADGRVDLAWRLWADEAVEGFRIYKKPAGDSPLAALENGSLVPATAQSYRDTGVRPGQTYYYQVAAVTPDGSEIRSRTVEASVPPPSLELDQNFPNPFNPTTTIRFSAPEGVRVRLAVYDVDGRLVATLYEAISAGGAHEVQWSGRSGGGGTVGTGVYFYRLHAGKHTLTRKMLLLK